MSTYERVLYREDGKVKTATLRDPVVGTHTLSGVKMAGFSDTAGPQHTKSTLVIHLTRSMISRTPLRVNSNGTEFEEI